MPSLLPPFHVSKPPYELPPASVGNHNQEETADKDGTDGSDQSEAEEDTFEDHPYFGGEVAEDFA